MEVYIDNTLYESHNYELFFMQTIPYSNNYIFIFLSGHKMNCLFYWYMFAHMQMYYSSKHCFQMYFFNDVIKTYFLFKLLFYYWYILFTTCDLGHYILLKDIHTLPFIVSMEVLFVKYVNLDPFFTITLIIKTINVFYFHNAYFCLFKEI